MSILFSKLLLFPPVVLLLYIVVKKPLNEFTEIWNTFQSLDSSSIFHVLQAGQRLIAFPVSVFAKVLPQLSQIFKSSNWIIAQLFSQMKFWHLLNGFFHDQELFGYFLPTHPIWIYSVYNYRSFIFQTPPVSFFSGSLFAFTSFDVLFFFSLENIFLNMFYNVVTT